MEIYVVADKVMHTAIQYFLLNISHLRTPLIQSDQLVNLNQLQPRLDSFHQIKIK